MLERTGKHLTLSRSYFYTAVGDPYTLTLSVLKRKHLTLFHSCRGSLYPHTFCVKKKVSYTFPQLLFTAVGDPYTHTLSVLKRKYLTLSRSYFFHLPGISLYPHSFCFKKKALGLLYSFSFPSCGTAALDPYSNTLSVLKSKHLTLSHSYFFHLPGISLYPHTLCVKI